MAVSGDASIALAADDVEARARHVAHELFRFGAAGWKVQSELFELWEQELRPRLDSIAVSTR